MGEKHTNRTRPVRKIILRIMHSLTFNRTKVARVVQSPKQALITSSSSEPAGPLISFLSDGWNNVFYQMVVTDHTWTTEKQLCIVARPLRVIYKTRSLHCLLPGELNRTFLKTSILSNDWNNVYYWMVASDRTKLSLSFILQQLKNIVQLCTNGMVAKHSSVINKTRSPYCPLPGK